MIAELRLRQVYYDFALTVRVFLELHTARVSYFEQVMAPLANNLSRLLAVQTFVGLNRLLVCSCCQFFCRLLTKCLALKLLIFISTTLGDLAHVDDLDLLRR